MADQKVSDLPSLNGVDVDPADLLYIVDSSAGTAGSKKITIGQYQLAAYSAGTANQVQYLNASKVLTGSTNLTFDGTSLTLGGNPTLSAGTANGVMYLNGSKVVTTGSGLVFDGTNFSTTGTASATKLIPTGGTATGNGMYLPAANTLAWSNNGAETMRLDSSGNLGLGVTPSAWGSNYKVIQNSAGAFTNYSTSTVQVLQNGYDSGIGAWKYSATAAATRYDQAAGEHRFFNAPSGTAGNAISFTQAMTLDASGNLLVGTTNSSVGTAVGFRVVDSGGRLECGSANTANANIGLSMYSTGAAAYRFYVGWGGTIFATSTTISAISDQRLKENVQDLDVGLDKIMALKPRKFDWKPGKGKDIKGDRGWIAQEFEQVFPDMVDQWLDSAPEGEEPYKSVRADLIPVLVKAMQEQQALINDLRARVAALEAQ